MVIANRRMRKFINRCCEAVRLPWPAFPPIPSDNRILFHRRDRDDFGCFSNFYPCPVEIEGFVWPHTEAYYQSRKSENPAYRARILEKDKPSWSKYVGDSRLGDPKIARQSWFRKHPRDLRADWSEMKLAVMRQAVGAKFSQNRNLGRMLRGTGDAEIVEDSVSDNFWGCGQNGGGANWLGVILMECREALQ